jgi:hypothetical protein
MTAPNLFFLQVHPDQAQILQANPNLLEGLTDIIMDTGLETGLNFSRRPVVRVLPDPQLQPGMIQVVAQNLREDLSHTATVDVIYPEATAQAFPDRAFLIVNGTRFFSLDQAIINIGRHADNQLVIDDVRISRRHAQLRAVRGRFMLFDLDSAGGTWVNGQLVNQSLLAPGDVISLAGVPLVFGQETQLPDETVDYRPL